jgi:toxin ParE1/3/4
MRALVFTRAAREELLQAVHYHEQEREGLGRKLLAAVQALAERLLDYPESGPVLFRDVRRAAVRRFRYDLVYRIQPEALIIVAVAHHSRRPGYWKHRL